LIVDEEKKIEGRKFVNEGEKEEEKEKERVQEEKKK